MTPSTFALVAMTAQDPYSWDPTTLSCGPFYLGPGYDRWMAGLTRQPRALDSGLYVIEGIDALEFLSKFDAVALWHWPTGGIVKTLQERGVRVGLATSYESISNVVPWDGKQSVLWQLLWIARLLGVDGKPVSIYPAGVKSTAWAIDIARHGLARAYVDTLEHVVRQLCKCMPDFIYFDNVMPRPFYGAAANAPDPNTMATAYFKAWQEVIDLVQMRLCPVWANTLPPGLHVSPTYARIWGTYIEHFIRHKHVLQEAINASMERFVIIDSEMRDGYFKRKSVEEMPASMAVCVARTGNAFQLYDPWSIE